MAPYDCRFQNRKLKFGVEKNNVNLKHILIELNIWELMSSDSKFIDKLNLLLAGDTRFIHINCWGRRGSLPEQKSILI